MPEPLREIDLGSLDMAIAPGPGGALYARSVLQLETYDTQVTAWLDLWAARAPRRVFLAERDATGNWRALTYAEARAQVRALATALLGWNLGLDRPLVILSGNSIAHALVALAALYVGIPYAPVSPAYALASADFGALRRVIDLLTPGLVFVDDGRRFGAAIAAAVPQFADILAVGTPPPKRRADDLATLFATPETPALDAAHAAVRPETIAKFLLTSGSTATPKAVVTTQRMLCANQTMIASALRFLRDEPPVLVDWLPWHHSFGGNQNFNLVLRHGGTLYIDAGKPTDIAMTLANLREISPTLYFNVPRGFEALLPHLVRDKLLAESFFRRMQLAFFAGASLSRHCLDRFAEIAAQTCGERIPMMSGYGATETSPAVAFAIRDGALLPLPGSELKLVAAGERYEARIKGPHVTPGYWRREDLTRRAFDADGYYRLGDALRIAETGGFWFDGRLDEDFKLATGAWVSVGTIREQFLEAFAPYVKDLAIAGAGEADLAGLVFADVAACRALSGLGAQALATEILAHPAVLDKFRSLLSAFAAPGSSRRIARIALLHEPPQPGEVTEKGGLNQSAVLANRAPLVRDLYAGRNDAIVVIALEVLTAS
jgi:feruloyl-CoA synthase